MKNHNGNYAKIVTIGSGNIEYVMQLGGEFRIGKKSSGFHGTSGRKLYQLFVAIDERRV